MATRDWRADKRRCGLRKASQSRLSRRLRYNPPMEELRQRLANLAEHVAGIMVRL